MGNSVPGNKANVGIAAGGEISASEAIVNVRSTGQGTQVGLMAGRATQFENESVQATANSAGPTGISLRAPLVLQYFLLICYESFRCCRMDGTRAFNTSGYGDTRTGVN